MKRAWDQFKLRGRQREEAPSNRAEIGASSRRLLLGARPRLLALTLLEMMVAITLLAVIMVGLLMMFNQTQKALHIASQQSDVFEATRATVQMISRDLTELSDFNQPGVKNCYSTNFASLLSGGVIVLPSGTNQPLNFGEAFWLTRANDDWAGVGYFVDGGKNSGIGTLYRSSASARGSSAAQTINQIVATNIPRPVMDGVVHFAMSAVYVTNHSTYFNQPVATFERASTFVFPFSYTEDALVTSGVPPMTNKVPVSTRIALPAFIDIEFGVLEPAALKQFQSLTGSVPVSVSQNFLVNHVGQIHFFRERVPVRNFVNPYRSNEAP